MYIGLFSGALFIFLGLALRYLPTPAEAPWMREVAPYLLIGYGLFRIVISTYLVWRKRRPHQPLSLVLLSFLICHCSSGPEDNLHIRFAYDGECASCPIGRMDSLLRLYFAKAVVETVYDSAKDEVLLRLDSNHVKLDTIIQVLLAYGYEVNEELPSDPILSSCCAAIETQVQSESGALFSEANPREDISALEQDLETHLSEEPPLPQEELSFEDDLGDLENLDLQDTGDMGLDEGLDDLGLEDDLDLDDGIAQPKKSSPKKPK